MLTSEVDLARANQMTCNLWKTGNNSIYNKYLNIKKDLSYLLNNC